MTLLVLPDLPAANEPTTALDVTLQQEIRALTDGLVTERSMALLLISHCSAEMAGQDVKTAKAGCNAQIGAA